MPRKKEDNLIRIEGGNWPSAAAPGLDPLGQGLQELAKMGDLGPYRAWLANMFSSRRMGAGGMHNPIAEQNVADAFAWSAAKEDPNLQVMPRQLPRSSAPSGYSGTGSMSVGGGQSSFQKGLAEESARAKLGLKQKEKDLALQRKYANLALQDRLNMVRSLLGKALGQNDVQKETYYERQAGELVPLTRTTTRNRDYTAELMRILGM